VRVGPLAVPSCGVVGRTSNLVDDALSSFGARAVGTAVPMAVYLNALSEDLTAAVLTHGRHAMHSARERIEYMSRPVLSLNDEGERIVITADFATSHIRHG
jgi:hypothetical protein